MENFSSEIEEEIKNLLTKIRSSTSIEQVDKLRLKIESSVKTFIKEYPYKSEEIEMLYLKEHCPLDTVVKFRINEILNIPNAYPSQNISLDIAMMLLSLRLDH